MRKLLALLFLALPAIAQSGHSATLSWQDALNPVGTTANIWRASGACPATAPTTTPPPGFTQINTAAVAESGSAGAMVGTYIDTAVTAGDTYSYVITAVGPNGQSNPSNCAQGVIPAAFPVSGVTVNVK
jgi:hypothetical protein